MSDDSRSPLRDRRSRSPVSEDRYDRERSLSRGGSPRGRSRSPRRSPSRSRSAERRDAPISRRGDQETRGPPPSGGQTWRSGDWECRSCGFHNFASRSRCKQCNAPSESGGDRDQGGRFDRGSKYGDRRGGYGRDRYDTRGRGSRFGDRGDRGYRGGSRFGDRDGRGGYRGGDRRDDRGGFGDRPARGQPEFRDGDWMCPSCNGHNFSRKTECFKCGASKA